MSSSDLLRVERLGAAWAGIPVLADVSFAVAPGEYVVLMGPNGSGKTTLLRQIVGLDAPGTGAVALGGRDLRGVPPHRRGIGFLPQEVALLPGRTVYENVAYGLEIARRPRAEVDRRVREVLDLLRLRGLEDRRPAELSGGERQRAALARTLAPRPRLVLLDEPLAAVDPELRGELRGELRRVFARLGVAAVHVTHDREEGLWLGDRVLLLIGGRLVQDGRSAEVYERPAGPAAARFLGYNLLPSPDGGLLAVAPRDLRLAETGEGIPVRVIGRGPVGGEWLVEVETDDGRRLEVRLPTPPVPETGARLRLGWGRAARFPSEGASPRPPSPI